MSLQTTLCWNCNHEYGINAPCCSACGMANANIHPNLAYAQMNDDMDWITEYTMRQGEMGSPDRSAQ